MENRIKDQQLGLFAHRTSSLRWWSNQFRQLLSGLAYVMFQGMRRLALKKSRLSKRSPQTLRLIQLKIGAIVIRKTRRVIILLSSSYCHQALFREIALNLNIS